MTLHVISTLSADLPAIALLVDTACGYPCHGEQSGGGIHCPPADCMTHTHAEVLAHPDGTRWAYIYDDVTAPFLVGRTPEDLGADWFPE
jgi:hypothetical protein